MKKAIAFIMGVGLAYWVHAQNNSTLSTVELLEQLPSATTTEQKTDIYFWLSYRYCNVLKLDSARMYSAALKKLGEQTRYEPGMGKYYFINGRLLYLVQNFSETEVNYNRALEIFSRHKNILLLGLTHKFFALNQMGLYADNSHLDDIRKNLLLSIGYLSKLPASGDLAHAYQVLAYEFSETYEIDSAVYYLVTAIRCAENTNSQRVLFNSSHLLGQLHLSVNDWEKAYEHFHNALSIPSQVVDKVMLRSCLGAYAICLIEKKDFPLADSAIKQYAALNKILGDEFGEIQMMHVNGAYAFSKGNYAAAVKFFSTAYKQYGPSTGRSSAELIDIVFRLARAEIETGNYISAIRHLQDVLQLAETSHSAVYNMKSQFELARAYKALGRIDSSFHYLDVYAVLKDSLLSIQKQRAVVELAAQYETEKKEQQIKLLQNENEFQAVLATRESQRKNFAYIAIAAVLLFGSYAFYRYRQHKRMSKQLARSLKELEQAQEQLIRIEKEKEAENIRSAISRDIHDEVGSTLSGVALFSEIARQKMKEHKGADVSVYLEHISANSKDMVQKMSDIVWAINPENDSFGRIISKFQSLAMNLCAGKNIKLHTRIDNAILDEHPEMHMRKNIYLFIKEALNNAVKYSGAGNLYFSLEKQSHTVVAVIRDDGKGFDTNAHSPGNGLNNMRTRACELNGLFTLISNPGKGTMVRLEFNFHPAGGHRKVV